MAYELRDYQKEDLELLLKDYQEKKKKNKNQMALINWATGLGKTNLFISWSISLLNSGENYGIMVFPTLKILNQTYFRFSEQSKREIPFTKQSKREIPFLIFASKGPRGVLRIIDTDKFDYWLKNTEKAVIFTTYKSFAKLLGLIHPDFVVFDECHRFIHPILLEKDTHYLAVSATPTYGIFDVISKRDINWGIGNNYLVNFCLNFMKSTSPIADIQEILKYNKKLLVICSEIGEANYITEILLGLNIPAESITSKDSQNEREMKENFIKYSKIGVIVSVRIYIEGADLPWLDSLYYCRKPVKNEVLIQSVGRILRPSQGKKIANIYFPMYFSENNYLKYCVNAITILDAKLWAFHTSSEEEEELCYEDLEKKLSR